MRAVHPAAHGVATLDDTEPGDSLLRAATPGYETVDRPITVLPGATTQAGVFELTHHCDGPSPVPVRGRVTLVDDDSHAGTEIRLRFEADGLPFAGPLLTDASGAFEVPASPEESYVLTIARPGYAEVPDIPLAPDGESGTFLGVGRTIPHARHSGASVSRSICATTASRGRWILYVGHGHEDYDAQPANIVRHVLVRHLSTFLERAEQAEGLPKWVTDELRDYVSCGDLSRGFARVRCDDCGADRLVGFSCGGRGFCPRCGGRRMSDTAAYLADQVLHDVPVRQWVLTVPWWLRARLHYDHELAGQVLRIFVKAIGVWLRDKCGGRGQPGAVTVIQRFGSALRAHLHFHTLMPHGTYAERADGSLQFLAAPVPTVADVEAIASTVATKVQALLDDRDLYDHYGHGDLIDDEPALRACVSAAANHQQLLGPEPGRPTERETTVFVSDHEPKEPPLAAQVEGFNLHAGVHVRSTDSDGLERLCRYIARPPLAQKRLRLLEGDRVAIDLRHPWRDGTSAIILDPLDFISRLAALVPPPRCNLVRYHGALAPNAKLRSLIVREAPPLLASARGHTRPKGKATLRRRLFSSDIRN